MQDYSESSQEQKEPKGSLFDPQNNLYGSEMSFEAPQLLSKLHAC